MLRNILISPIVLFVRAPIIAILLLLIKVGEIADKLYEYANAYLPAFRDYK